MDFEEIMNETPDDASVEEVVETEETEPAESLETITDEPVEEVQETPRQEPGYVKGRIDKAVAKAVAETEARMQAMFDQQMAPIRARMMEDEAQELVRNKKVADIDTARELVSLRNGQPVQREQKREQAPQNDVETSTRISMLEHQAKRIKASTGLDVTAEFMRNEDIKQRVVSGELDFYDVADMMKTRKRPPSPMRSPNGASSMNPNAISNMTDEQFERMEKRIKEGARYELK